MYHLRVNARGGRQIYFSLGDQNEVDEEEEWKATAQEQQCLFSR